MPKTRSKKVSFQGERGAYSEIASLRFFKIELELFPCRTFEEVFQAVEQRKVEFGVIPIENSLAGSIHQNYDLLLKYHLQIVGEKNLRVEHNLIAHPQASLKQIKRIFSHTQALMQCQNSTAKLGELEIIPVYDTAGAVKKIRDERLLDGAAIASDLAARLYGMKILRRGIEDNPENYTRFLILSRKTRVAPEADKTSIVFSLKNLPGVLFRALSVFALRDVDLYKIESRPLHGRPWEYFFYIDFAGNLREENCRNAISHLSEIATFLKILGSYQKDSQ
jgi:prephenate dehydratase